MQNKFVYLHSSIFKNSQIRIRYKSEFYHCGIDSFSFSVVLQFRNKAKHLLLSAIFHLRHFHAERNDVVNGLKGFYDSKNIDFLQKLYLTLVQM